MVLVPRKPRRYIESGACFAARELIVAANLSQPEYLDQALEVDIQREVLRVSEVGLVPTILGFAANQAYADGVAVIPAHMRADAVVGAP